MAKTKALISTQRKKKPKEMAVITDQCTGCSGAPTCIPLCPVEDCMNLIMDEDSAPFGYIWVDPVKCIGCKKCITKGPEGIWLDGCPWDAIEMVPTSEWESENGLLDF